MHRSKSLRPRPAPYIDKTALRRQALALRGYCRRHRHDFPLNVMRNGRLTANACELCYPNLWGDPNRAA